MERKGFYKITENFFNIPEVGVGIIGYGFMGKTHANAYKKCFYMTWPPVARAKLIAIYGKLQDGQRLIDELINASYRFGFEGYYTDFDDMLNDERINLVDNCAPDDVHYDLTLRAIKAGKNVICEKPLATNVKDARDLYDTAVKSGIKHMLSHNYRFFPAVGLAKDLIDKGIFGKIYEFRGAYFQSIGSDPHTVVENVWYATGTKSGVNLGIGCHLIDTARFLIGEIKTVSAIQKTFNTKRKNKEGIFENICADESNYAILEFENGAIGSLESSGLASGRLNQHTWEIYASGGSMYWDLEDPNHLYVFLKNSYQKEISGFTKVSVTQGQDRFSCLSWPPGDGIGWENGHINEIYHLLDCIANNKNIEPYGATFYDGYVIQLVMDAIKNSSLTGKKIEIKVCI